MADRSDKTENTLSVLKLVLVALLSSALGGFGVASYLNRNYTSLEDHEELKSKMQLMEEKYRAENLEIRVKMVESNQQWIATTLMAIAFKVGVQVDPPPMSNTPR